MPRPEKVQAVAEIKERLENARAVFVAEYAGLSVQQQQQLRRGLRDTQAEFKVVKMTLAQRAASDLGFQELADLLVGPTGLAFADDDAVSSAKALKDFAGSNEALVIKGGMLGDVVLTPERISDLADLEPREVQLSKIAGAFKAPLTNMAGLLAAMPRNIASMMQQLVEKKESEAPAGDTAPEEPVAEAPAAEEAEAPAEEAAEAPAEETAEAAAPEADAPDASAAEASAAEATEKAEAEPDDSATDSENETADEAEEE